MEYLVLRPFTAESPGNTKVHQGGIYSSLTGGTMGDKWLLVYVRSYFSPTITLHTATWFDVRVLSFCAAVGGQLVTYRFGPIPRASLSIG